MLEVLQDIQDRLDDISEKLDSSIPSDDPFGNAKNSWSLPGITKSELMEQASSIVELIDAQGGDELGEHEARLLSYVSRLQHLHQQTVPQLWSYPDQALFAYITTLQGLRKALEPVLTRDLQKEAADSLKRVTQKVRAMESEMDDLGPRSSDIKAMVEQIERAHEAAYQLPVDLVHLKEARQKITDLLDLATKQQNDVERIEKEASEIGIQLKRAAEEAQSVLVRCETAYSAATSVGLAAAFSERSSTLSKSMWVWVAGLIAALAAGSCFGSAQLHSLMELFRMPNVSAPAILLNVLLSVLSVGAPVWFAWLATKQIGHRFRLAEDYAFKASISRAYEGFRREAARIDTDMEARLLASALTRLDELPLRLVENDSHGSPWHELASSGVVRQAMQSIPGFAEQVKELATDALRVMMPVKTSRAEKHQPPLSSEVEPDDKA